MSVIKLDCTLRDGGYYTNWYYDPLLVKSYLDVMVSNNIDYVELGYRYFHKKSLRGPFAYTSEKFLSKLFIPETLKIAVMINLTEILPFDTSAEEAIKKFFCLAEKSKVSLVRVACYSAQIKEASLVSSILKDMGYKTSINLMQVSSLSSCDLKKIIEALSAESLDVLYFADSFGNLNAKRILEIIEVIKKYCNYDIGFHAHDNKNMALSNTLFAIENGVSWVDSTVYGMGRGAGNVKTEYLLSELYKDKDCLEENLKMISLIRDYFFPLHNLHKWGANIYYYLAAQYEIHPTYVQDMLMDNKFGDLEILSMLKNLKTNKPSKFIKNKLEEIYNNLEVGSGDSWNPEDDIFGKEVLILGSGPSSLSYRAEIEFLVKDRKPFVIALNSQDSLDPSLINLRAICHPVHLTNDSHQDKLFDQRLVIPFKLLNAEPKKYPTHLRLQNFNVRLKKDTFEIKEDLAILPSLLVAGYAFAIAIRGKATRIFLAGFDGYAEGDPRMYEMNALLSLYFENPNSIPLHSISPTCYKIPTVSVYDL